MTRTDPAPPLPRPRPTSAPPVPAPVDEHYRILLIEDDPGDALLVEEMLTDTDLRYTLRHRTTMAQALAHLAREAADCVLLDLHLTDASGVEGVDSVLRAAPDTAVIVLTGLVDAGAGSRAVATGAQDYLVKGLVDAQLLQRAVRYAVHRKEAGRAAAELRENQIRAQENARLERGLLPAPLLTSADVTVASRYLPGRERALLGGDFLDVVQTSDGCLHALIGDVSGHGPDEAALGVCLRITWRALTLAGHRDTELLALLEQVLVAERTRPDVFATCATLTLSPDRGRAVVHLAGHHAPLLRSEQGWRDADAPNGIALGMLPGHGGWEAAEFRLPPSGALLLFTDGLIEGHVGDGPDRLGTEGLVALVRDAGPLAPDRLLDHLVTTADALNRGRHSDDLAILHLAWGT
ncbi:PP2C family protein-serine/threonine phosphatase [Kitasatospora paranensis]|uniref:PP2C family protein-serine/threonine phosphatase n=1 Tax=Kitasatospora paranensis TaxID=258053 RepID=A0ABW2G2X8_9ACTN